MIIRMYIKEGLKYFSSNYGISEKKCNIPAVSYISVGLRHF